MQDINIDLGAKTTGSVAVTAGGSVGIAQVMDSLNSYIGLFGIIIAIISLSLQVFFNYRNYKLQLEVLALDALRKELRLREQNIRAKELEQENDDIKPPIIIT